MFTPATVYWCMCRDSLSRAPVTRRAPGLQVWNRVMVSRSAPHTPPNFSGSTPGIFRTPKAGHCARRYLRRSWKLGLRIFAWSKQRMFCEESLEKIEFRAFPKRIGPRILSLVSADYSGASEHYWVVEKKILISKIAMVECCKLSLYANESCNEIVMRFIFGDWNDVPWKSLFRYLAMM